MPSPVAAGCDSAQQQRRRPAHGMPLLACLCATWLLLSPWPARAQAPQVQLELTVWQYGVPGEDALYRDIVAGFERENPGVDVRLSMLTWDGALETARRLLEGRDTAPDVIVIRDEWLPRLASLLRPLTDDVERAARRDYYEGPLDACCYGQGRLYGIPWMTRTQALYYRPSVLRRAKVKVPKKWSGRGGVVDVAARVASPPDMFGFGIAGASRSNLTRLFLPMLWAVGGRLENDSGEVVFDVEALHVLTLFCDLAVRQHGAQPEALSYTQGDIEALFVVGKLAMLVDGPWFGWYLQGNFPDLDYGVAPLPRGVRAANLVSVDFLAVPTNSDQPELALRLIEYLTRDRFLSAFAQLGGLPAKRSVVRREDIAKDELLGPFAQALENAEGLPTEIWSQLEPALATTISEVVSGRKTPSEARDDFQPRGLKLHARESGAPETPPGAATAGGGARR